MIRRRKRKLVISSLFFAISTPILALLCRGHSPSRYDTYNLPAWALTPPTPSPIKIAFNNAPLSPQSVHTANNPALYAVLHADEDQLFESIDAPLGHVARRVDAGMPGTWLENSKGLDSEHTRLSAKQDRVAERLMNAQDADGYLGSPTAVRDFKAEDIAAHCNNLIGLLAYYDQTKNQGTIYAAMKAGYFLLNNYDPTPGLQEPGAEARVVYALTRLYQATGEQKFLAFAERESDTLYYEPQPATDVIGWCALYEATGSKTFLRQAEEMWDAKHSPAQSAAELFKLTGKPKYMQTLALMPNQNPCRWPLAYSRTANAVSVNMICNSEAQLGTIWLRAQTDRHGKNSILIKTPHPAKTAIQLFLPALPAGGNAPISSANHTSSIQISINGKPLRGKYPLGHYATIDRVWNSGDKIQVDGI